MHEASGLGISIVPRSTSNFHTKDVAYVNIEQEAPHVEISLAWRLDDHSSLVRQFLNKETQSLNVMGVEMNNFIK
jgi:DNA-binding transcriptional LysR family regulator